jgi:hypothetical protein
LVADIFDIKIVRFFGILIFVMRFLCNMIELTLSTYRYEDLKPIGVHLAGVHLAELLQWGLVAWLA